MAWSFKIGRIAGINIRVHVSFFLLFLIGAFQWQQLDLQGALFSIAMLLLLFVCVLLHELGHGVVANRFDVPVREIILLPLGGVAMLERNPRKPLHELLIAAAGPLVNVVIALVLLIFLGVGNALGYMSSNALLDLQMEPSLATAAAWLMYANISLVVFNLIPAFPLDGGRILRAALAIFIGMPRATRIATFVGQALAIVLGAYAVASGNLLLILVAVFIFFGAGQENAVGQARTVLTTLRVGDAYNKYALTLAIGDRVSKVVDYILTSYQPDFAVLQGNRLLGVVTREDVLRSLASDTGDGYVTGIMRREVLQVEANETLEEVSQKMSSKQSRVAAVYDGESYLGLVSLEDIAEAFAVITYQKRQQDARNAEAKA